MRSIILGSSSKSRQLILSELNFNFIIISPQINEKLIGCRLINSSPYELVLEVSRAKSNYILENKDSLIPQEYLNSILLTGDTVVYHNNQIIEKPQTKEEFISNLKSYSNSNCLLVSGIVMTDIRNGKSLEVCLIF